MIYIFLKLILILSLEWLLILLQLQKCDYQYLLSFEFTNEFSALRADLFI